MFFNKKKQEEQPQNLLKAELLLEDEEKRWAQEKNLIQRKNKINEEKKKLKDNKTAISTTKLIVAFLFINCTIIEIFTGWVTIKSLEMAAITGQPADLTPLATLVGAVVSEIIGFAVYAAKSAKENSKGGITYDLAMRNFVRAADEEIMG